MPTTVPHDGNAPAEHDTPRDNAGSATGTGATAIDPVCGMTVTLKPDSRTCPNAIVSACLIGPTMKWVSIVRVYLELLHKRR